MPHSTSKPSEEASWWLAFERPRYPQATISSSDIHRGLRFRFYHSRWSRHHEGLRLFDSFVMSVQSEVTVDNSAPRYSYIRGPRSVVTCYNHDAYSKVNHTLSDLGLEPHRTQWGPMWDLSAFCTSIDAPQMRWEEPRPNHEGRLDVGDLRKGMSIYFHTGTGKRLMGVMSDVTYHQTEVNSAYGGARVLLYASDLRKESSWSLEDLGILPYMNPNGVRWGDSYCTAAPTK